MNIEDIRLTPDEIFEGINMEQVANTATDKAIKKIFESLIFYMRDVGGINPEWAISDRNYKEFKKLTEEKEDELSRA